MVWLVLWNINMFLFPYIGKKSSQLTKSYFSGGWKTPTRWTSSLRKLVKGQQMNPSGIHSTSFVWTLVLILSWSDCFCLFGITNRLVLLGWLSQMVCLFSKTMEESLFVLDGGIWFVVAKNRTVLWGKGLLVFNYIHGRMNIVSSIFGAANVEAEIEHYWCNN